jgi:ribonuclease Z
MIMLYFIALPRIRTCLKKIFSLVVVLSMVPLLYSNGILKAQDRDIEEWDPYEHYPSYLYPNEVLAGDEIRVIALGSGTPTVRRGQFSPSFLVELGNGFKFLFDVGTGSHANFIPLGIPYKSVNHVFISHLHTDHIGDLDAFWTGRTWGVNETLKVYGPSGRNKEEGTAAFVENFLRTYTWDRRSRQGILNPLGQTIEAHEFDYRKRDVVFDRDGATITAFPAVHALDGAVSYRLDWNGYSVVYSGDTKPTKWLVENSKGVDLLIHESFPSPQIYAKKVGISLKMAENIAQGVHTPPSSVAQIFELTKPKMAAIYHLYYTQDIVNATWDEVRNIYKGPLYIVDDLTVFNIGRNGVFVRDAITSPDAMPRTDPSTAGKEQDMEDKIPMSDWLLEGEYKFKDTNTDLQQ